MAPERVRRAAVGIANEMHINYCSQQHYEETISYIMKIIANRSEILLDSLCD
jgi:hypothetical protein